MSDHRHIDLWNRCLAIIRDNVQEQAYKTWFLPIVPKKYEDNTLTVQVSSQFFYEYLEDKYIDLIRQTLYKVFGEGTKLMYDVTVVNRPKASVNIPSTPHVPTTPAKPVQTKQIPQTPVVELDPHLIPNYNFDTFIEGISNKLSRSVAEAVAQDPAKTVFNPLFIYGASGVGKTHLVNAIGTRIKEFYPQKRVLYVSAHLFQVQYTDSVRNNTTNDFIKFYQTIDVLIIDDIQEFAGATKTQNTFFHIFNHLHQNGKQLILTSDRTPAQLQGMEERLITRFKWGMVAELEKPTVELRKDILRNKIKRDGLKFPPEVIDFIAENVGDSVRDLEGIVISIMAHATVYNKNVTLELAERVVRKISRCEKKEISVNDIVELVCKHYGVPTSTIYTKTRKREVVLARQVSMYLAKKNTELSAAKIGVMIGNKDHATVVHACKTIKEQISINKNFSAEVDELQNELKR